MAAIVHLLPVAIHQQTWDFDVTCWCIHTLCRPLYPSVQVSSLACISALPIHSPTCADQAHNDSLLCNRYLLYHESCGRQTKCSR